MDKEMLPTNRIGSPFGPAGSISKTKPSISPLLDATGQGALAGVVVRVLAGQARARRLAVADLEKITYAHHL
jgi:hypothetical protein